MKRTKVIKYYYGIIKQDASGKFEQVGTVESDHEIKSKKETDKVLSEENAPDGAKLMLVDTEVGTFEMSDSFFFEHASRIK